MRIRWLGWADALNSGKAFAAMDRLLDEARGGAFYLRQPAVALLALTGSPLGREFEKIRNYIEGNPVRAGLVREAREYRWSSAGWAIWGSPADGGVRPTTNREL